jgi:peptide deformylase
MATIGDPRLKMATVEVDDVADVSDLLDGMVERLPSLNGAGLAAPQVGASVKVVVVEVRRTRGVPRPSRARTVQMINPVIVISGEAAVDDWRAASACRGLWGWCPARPS